MREGVICNEQLIFLIDKQLFVELTFTAERESSLRFIVLLLVLLVYLEVYQGSWILLLFCVFLFLKAPQ